MSISRPSPLTTFQSSPLPNMRQTSQTLAMASSATCSSLGSTDCKLFPTVCSTPKQDLLAQILKDLEDASKINPLHHSSSEDVHTSEARPTMKLLKQNLQKDILPCKQKSKRSNRGRVGAPRNRNGQFKKTKADGLNNLDTLLT